MPKKRVRYDAVVKDLFQKDRPTLLGMLAGPAEVLEFLQSEFPIVQERVADLVLALSDESILHLEFQSTNHAQMPLRVGIYGLLAVQKHRRKRIRQVVIYMGEAPMRMQDRLDLGGIRVEYQLIDIREFDAEQLIASGNPGDLALAFLARGGVERLAEIVRRASRLKEEDRRRVLLQMTMLSGLRMLSKPLRMEMKKMGVYIEIEKNVILREIRDSGKAEGKAEGIAEGLVRGNVAGVRRVLRGLLETKFGPLPKWAVGRVQAASDTEAHEWAQRVLTVDTLEGILGKK